MQGDRILDIGISAHHSTAKHFSKAASEAITALSLNFYSASHIIAFSRDYIANRNIFPVDISVRLHEYETAILQLNFKAAKDVVSVIYKVILLMRLLLRIFVLRFI